MTNIDDLEARALAGDAAAVRSLTALARAAKPAENLYRVTTEDGLDRVMTVEEFLRATATDLARCRVEMVRQ